MAQLMADLDPRRQASHLELPLHTICSLIYDPRGIHFNQSAAEIEWVFWSAATTWTLEPGVREVLAFLEEASVPCGIVSNTMFREQTIARQLAASGLDGVLPWVITSAEHVVRKPHPRLFALAAQRLRTPPADPWFVGDSFECDVQGAAAAGMVPIWYCPKGPPGKRIEPALRSVASRGELHDLLQAALGVR
jgi:putative hydrolase of the HAD superfamily